MKLLRGNRQFEIPVGLHEKLLQFRRRVWTVKLLEGVFVALLTLNLSYLAVFVSDRLCETPLGVRLGLLLFGLSGLLMFLPWMAYRWVWRQRQLTDLAKLLAQQRPRVGDRLLGIIELVQDLGDRHASPTLCRAAIDQVADETREIDFLTAVPTKRHRRCGGLATVCMGFALLALLVPSAGTNALARWARPFSNITRYTFAQLVALPDRLVVPVGEPFTVSAKLADSSVWSPTQGRVKYAKQPRVTASIVDGHYRFNLPAQTAPGVLAVAVGDARHRIHIEPKSRPELTALAAHIELPEYLGHAPEQRDVRSGVISMVRGSRARFVATASRDIADAAVNGSVDGVTIKGPQITSALTEVKGSGQQQFQWTDKDGLSARSPFPLRIQCVDDRAPTLQCRNLLTESVVLDVDTLSFEIAADDDFGVKAVGLEWSAVEDAHTNSAPQKGEALVAAGDQQKASFTARGTFSPTSLGIAPQPIHLRVYAEDFLPGRNRVYSPTYRLYVLDRRQHMIWMTEQLRRWERQVLEVRDQEQQLLETNAQLHQLSPAELDKESNRQAIARQAAAERANAKRLASLTVSGEQLLVEATGNTEFNVTTLEHWAQMLAMLKQLAASDMPSVANLLGLAANAAKSTTQASPSTAPSVSDVEAGAQRNPQNAATEGNEVKASSQDGNTIGLPATTLLGRAKSGDETKSPAAAKIAKAVDEQTELLKEFNRVMGELAKLLQDLGGSTFVKRLKAAARNELGLASELHNHAKSNFGVDAPVLTGDSRSRLRGLNAQQNETAVEVRLIQEDLLAYFQRTNLANYKRVHDEMQIAGVVSNFKRMAVALDQNYTGQTIAQAEYWSDQLDRWAEILVGPG